MIQNRQEIKKITMMPTAITRCEIGQDWYKNEFEITFIPDKHYPDYIEVEKWIMDNIDGKEFNIEDAINVLYQFLQKTYHPMELYIRDVVKGNKVHFDVIVEK